MKKFWKLTLVALLALFVVAALTLVACTPDKPNDGVTPHIGENGASKIPGSKPKATKAKRANKVNKEQQVPKDRKEQQARKVLRDKTA